MQNENQKIGIGLSVLGLCLGGCGVILFFDRILLALSNLCFLAGICFILGIQRTSKFFFKSDKLRGTACCVGGFTLIVLGWAILGLLLEMYGLWGLFSAFLPNVVISLKMIPGVSTLLQLPIIRNIVEWIYDQRQLPV